jgi:predicted NACHT family NTPase
MVELRNLNDTSGNLKGYVRQRLERYLPYLNEEIFLTLLRDGAFVLLLDGFDEITHELRDRVGRQIQDLCQENLHSIVLVSSRPDDTVSSWQTPAEP